MRSSVNTETTDIWSAVHELQEDVAENNTSIVSINTQLTAVVNFLAILGFNNQPEPEPE